MKSIRKIFSYNLFIASCTMWAIVCFVLPDFLDNPIDGLYALIQIIGFITVVAKAVFITLYIAAANKYKFSLFLRLLVILGSIIGYYRYAFGAVLSPILIDATINNDIRTSLEVITIPLILFVLFNLLLSFYVIRLRFKKICLPKNWIHFLIAFILLAIYLNINNRIYTGVSQRYPYNLYYNLKLYNELKQEIQAIRSVPDTNIELQQDSLSVVFVLGETLRADHLHLNGYSRNTTPNLSKLDNLVSFANIYSEYTHTNRSLPHILTRADSVSPNIAFSETSFVSLFNQAGYSTSWLANQELNKTYISFANECDTIMYANKEKSVYVYDKWLDEDLLPFVDELFEQNKQQNLIILHTIGSHWYYNNHTTDEHQKFYPITKNRGITNNSKEEIINSYDNTILYTDYFINELILRLKSKNAILIYLSDHGEALGENGQWLHANDNQNLKNPACFIWFSDKYKNNYPSKFEAAYRNKDNNYRTDFLFHTILGAANIKTKILDESLNILNNNE